MELFTSIEKGEHYSKTAFSVLSATGIKGCFANVFTSGDGSCENVSNAFYNSNDAILLISYKFCYVLIKVLSLVKTASDIFLYTLFTIYIALFSDFPPTLNIIYLNNTGTVYRKTFLSRKY